MKRDLDELINDMESDALTRSELHGEIKELVQEIQKLKLKIEEQERIIAKQGDKDSEVDGLDDMQILKDMVKNQRKQITEKELIIEAFENRNATLIDRTKHEREVSALKSQVEQLQNENNSLKEQVNLYKVNDSNAREIIARLTEETNAFKSNEENSLKLLEVAAGNEEKHKIRADKLEEELERLKEKYDEDLAKLSSEHDNQKEELLINRVEYARRISELEAQIDKLTQSPPMVSGTKGAESGQYLADNKIHIDEINTLKTRLQKLSAEHGSEDLDGTESLTGKAESIKEHVYIEKLHSTRKSSSLPILNEEEDEEPVPIEFNPSISPAEAISNAKEDDVIPTPLSEPTYSETMSVIDGSRKCPKCGNQRKKLIHEELDKTNIIMAYPRLYGKKYRCGECGSNWRIRLSEIEILK